jgi:nitroreductase
MKSVANETIVKQLRWRYATKKFDPARKIPVEDWQTLEQALLLAPSSFGLQPWKFVVVTDPTVRARLREVSWGQPQITDASHLVVFAAKANLGPADVERYLARIAEVRGVALPSLDGFRQTMLGSLKKPQAEVANWTRRQVYIALGTFLTTAALLGIDACPMEGFQVADYDKILDLSHQGYGATVLAAAGYRVPEDPFAALAKVRYRPEDVIEHVKT